VEKVPDKPSISRNKDTLFTDAAGEITWYYEGNRIPRADEPILIITQFGDYVVEASNFCGSVFSDTLTVDNINAIDPGQPRDKGIRIYPVPAGDAFTVEIQSNTNQTAFLKIVNSMGAVVLEEQLNLSHGINKKRVEAGSLSNGLYLLRIRTSNNREYTGKIIIQ
jgi:hypothetical protein